MAVDIQRAQDEGRLLDFVGSAVKLTKDGAAGRYKGLCPFHQEKSPSFTIFIGNDGKERFHCFGCGKHGDVLDYIIETRGVSFTQAAEIITGEIDDTGSRAQSREKLPPPHDPYENTTPLPIPDNTPPIKVGERIQVWNPKREKFTNYTPSMVFLYEISTGAFGYVLRQDLDNGRKITPMVMWCQREGMADGWSHYTFPKPRPLYGRDFHKERKQLLIVEGEKTADAVRATLKTIEVVTWAGGTQAVEYSDWSMLADRDVIICGDADDPGRKAANEIALIAHRHDAKRIRLVNTLDQEKGWDLADTDWDKKTMLGFLKDNATPWAPEEAEPEPEPQPPATRGQDQVQDEDDSWRDLVIHNQDGTPKATSASNYITFLRFHPDLKGIFAYNEFSLEISITRCPPWDDERKFKPHPLSEEDIIFCQAHLERYSLSPKLNGTRSAIIAASSKNSFHPAREYFTTLAGKWDGKPRLNSWLNYYLGATDTPFSRVAGRKWLIASVRRIFEPGCKFDTMLILEGQQGIKKSFALRELATFGGEAYFTDAIADIHKKEASMMMQGVLIVEMAEMAGMKKSEIEPTKAWITRQEDQYRPPYASTIKKAPRQCVLAGTVNPEGGYLKDATGARRFWPVWCESVDLEGIKQEREQIWAEAYQCHMDGELIYLTGEEEAWAKEEQKERYVDDIWADDIDGWISGRSEITIRDIMDRVLDIPAKDRNELQKNRIKRHLTSRGWRQVNGREDLMGVRQEVFIPPEGAEIIPIKEEVVPDEELL